MPSLRGRCFRLIVKYFVGPAFRRAGESIPELRKIGERMARSVAVPRGTEVQPVSVNDVPAEWVLAPAPRSLGRALVGGGRQGGAHAPANRQGGGRQDVAQSLEDQPCAVLYLHGGAFVMGFPAMYRELAARLSATTRAPLLVVDYRLAPEHPFPAALQDAIAAYRWLLDNGYTEDRLVVGGDSAGGGLALQTLIALRDNGVALPAAGFFLSPPTDWVRLDGESYSTRVHVDPFISPRMCRFTASLYVGENDPKEPLLRPIDMDLSGLPPLCIHVGDHEVLLSDSIRFAERALRRGVDVELKIWPHMWHVFQTSARYVPEARRSLDEVGRFVRRNLRQ